jgi:hypothetical protein
MVLIRIREEEYLQLYRLYIKETNPTIKSEIAGKILDIIIENENAKQSGKL